MKNKQVGFSTFTTLTCILYLIYFFHLTKLTWLGLNFRQIKDFLSVPSKKG